MRNSSLAAILCLAACNSGGPAAISMGKMGSLTAESGKLSFRLGAASAATQIEDGNTNTDWYLWTEPTSQGGLGHDTFVDNAVDGYTKVDDDIKLLSDMHMDSYRFSMEWARIEPVQGQIDEDALAHYSDELDALIAAGIRPMVTIHHFSNPVWVADPRDPNCNAGPSSTNLCGLGGPNGAAVIQAMADHATLLAQRFGDRVDEWGTVNEPVNYLFAAYGAGEFPPGRLTISSLVSEFMPVVRDYISANAAMYKAIKAADTIDADGDGVAAAVGFTMSVADWEPARAGKISTNPDDIAARDKFVNLFHYLFVDAVQTGMFDSDLDGTPDESHPEWVGTMDWLGLQMYFRAGVTAQVAAIEPLGLTPCYSVLGAGTACLPALDPTYCVPSMGYEASPGGIGDVLKAFGARYPALPLIVSEGGIASHEGKRRAEVIVRTLEAINDARSAGVDVRGYYHWALTDNFEWANGFTPHFGLYTVDTTGARIATEGATVFGDIAQARVVTSAQRTTYGGDGPLTVDPDGDGSSQCIELQ